MTSPAQATSAPIPAHLALARAELARGVREDPPGSNTGPDVRRYLAPCVRHGRRLWTGEPPPSPWCAAFVSWCVWSAYPGNGPGYPPVSPTGWAPGEHNYGGPVIGYRASVAELCADARATGALRLPQAGESPIVGDLVVMMRDGANPLTGGIGHVEIVDEVMADGLWCIGGNAGPGSDAVARTLRRFGADRIVAWIKV